MALRRGHARAREEAFFIGKRIRRYTLLKEKIFSRISNYKLETGSLDEINNFKLQYDLSEIKSSSYYAEASEYMTRDLSASITRPEELERLVTEFNNDVDELIRKIIPSRTREILQRVTTISDAKKGALPPENTISLENITPSIQRYWILNRDFDTNYKNGSFKIDGDIVAKIPPELQDSLMEALLTLKNDSKLFYAINGNLASASKGLKQRRTELIKRGEDLSNSINDNIRYPRLKGKSTIWTRHRELVVGSLL